MLQVRPGAYIQIGNGDGSHRLTGTVKAVHAAQPEL